MGEETDHITSQGSLDFSFRVDLLEGANRAKISLPLDFDVGMPRKLGVFVVGDDEEDRRVSSSGDAVGKEGERDDEMSASLKGDSKGK